MNDNRKQPDIFAADEVDRDVYEWVQCVVVALFVCVIAFTFFFRMINVVGDSMYPTLEHADEIIVSRLADHYEPGDIVVLRKESFRSEAVVKRVIAVAGQTVSFDFETGTVYVDDIALDEPYVNEPTYKALDYTEPVKVPEGFVFVLGDNRNNSVDSRSSLIGCVDERYIIGKVVFRLLPLKKIGSMVGQ